MVVSYNLLDRNETTRQNLAVEKWLAYKSEFLGMKTITGHQCDSHFQ